jgi:hypothetical protein
MTMKSISDAVLLVASIDKRGESDTPWQQRHSSQDEEKWRIDHLGDDAT